MKILVGVLITLCLLVCIHQAHAETTTINQKGIDFCSNLLGGTWKQTSYNANIRKNYAGVGYTYDEGRDAFIAPKPYNSWLLDKTTCQWKAPVDYPTDDKRYTWNEETLAWNVINDN